ncbi:hypothetical protein B5S32_g685 [[Candida] boidinii]|nr:hypothetical protein B5S32_g685 [[Candida] boidinii]
MIDPIEGLVPLWKRLYHKWRSLKNVPFRKEWFIGYDLSGNSYWEFYVDKKEGRPRRKYIPYKRMDFVHDYYKTIPVQWYQWLRFTKIDPPSLTELIADQQRQAILKTLVKQNEMRIKLESNEVQRQQDDALKDELNKVENVSRRFNVNSNSNSSSDSSRDPIKSANNLRPRR